MANLKLPLSTSIPNYASAIVTTNEVVDSISGSRSECFEAKCQRRHHGNYKNRNRTNEGGADF